jgi:hypothetical protein
MTIPLGTAWLEAVSRLNAAESDLWDALTALGIDGFEDVGGDPHDDSLELLGCRPDLRLTPEQWSGVNALGFDRTWLNHTDNTETYYWRDGPAEGVTKPSPPHRRRA